MSVTVTLSYEERILNALTHVPRHRDDDAITRTKREFDTVREVLTPLYADRDRAIAAAKELRAAVAEAGIALSVPAYGTEWELANVVVQTARKAEEQCRATLAATAWLEDR